MQHLESYKRLYQELKSLLEREDKGKPEVLFADESGFSRELTVPYGWSEKGKRICVLSPKSKRINVFRMYSRCHGFKSFQSEESITAADVCGYLDAFAKQIEGATVVVLDNVSVHKAKELQAKTE